MGRIAQALTVAQVKKLPVGQHAVGGPVPGLVVTVGTTGARRWWLRRYLNGQQRMLALGGDLTLEQAYAAAAALAADLASGAARAKKPRAQAARPPGPPIDADNPYLGPIARALLTEAA
jgi:hypothetical protein